MKKQNKNQNYENLPYVKLFNEHGVLTNPITKTNGWFHQFPGRMERNKARKPKPYLYFQRILCWTKATRKELSKPFFKTIFHYLPQPKRID